MTREEIIAAREALRTKAEAEREALEDAYQAKLFELEQVHGFDAVRGVRTSKGGLFMRAPDGPAYRRWRAASMSDTSGARVEAMATLARSGCVLHPDKPTLDKWLDELPGLAELIANNAVELAGAIEVAYRGKA